MEKQEIKNEKEIKKQNAWANIDIEEERESEQAIESAKYEINPALNKIAFDVKPSMKPRFKTDAVVLSIKLHPNWTQDFWPRDAEATFIKLCGLDKTYKASVGRLTSRKPGKESVTYIGVSIKVEDQLINFPFDIKDFKSLEKIGFIKKQGV